MLPGHGATAMRKQRTGIIGAGTVGTALASCLFSKGYDIAAVHSRTSASARRLAGRAGGARVHTGAQGLVDAVDVVFVTTPDSAIPSVVSSLRWRAGQTVLHCSGADSLDILEPARKAGAAVGVIHPLQTFASIDQAMANLPGSSFSLEAEEPLLSYLKDMVSILGGQAVVLKSGDKVLYHAAAVMASNYVVTLLKLATDLWSAFGVGQAEASRALLPLLKGTLNNIEKVGLPNCLTGPIARGDMGTIRKHLKALGERAPALLSTYQELGLQTVPISLAKGRIDASQAEEIKRILSSKTGGMACE